jgi:hypothetical protein
MIRVAIRRRRNALEVLLAGAHGRAAAWHGSIDIAALNADQHAAISRVHEDSVAILTARLNWLINLDGQLDSDGEEKVTAFLNAKAATPVVTTEGPSTAESRAAA